jgi:radical SAM protein with 4Fe4S-binding SPASM domain
MFSKEDYQNVFGPSVLSVFGRARKAFSVLKSMMIGADAASSSLPLKLQVEVTDKCNFDCIMCDRLTREHVTYRLNNDVKDDQFERLIAEINPYYVTVNGLGEPLLNKDIGKLLPRCREAGIRTAMPSNLSVGKVLNSKILEHPPNVLTFSIHGATKEVFEAISVKSKFEVCMASLDAFMRQVDRKKTSVRVLCVVQRKNLTEYKGMYALLKRYGLLDDFVAVAVYDKTVQRTDEVIPTAAEKQAALARIEQDLLSADAEEKAFLENWQRVVREIKRNEPDAADMAGKPCLVPWFETYVSAKGDVLPCSYLTNEPHVMGNINDTPFAEIWNGERYRRFRAHLRDSRETLSGCQYCPRDDSSRLQQYGLPWKRKTQWPGQRGDVPAALSAEGRQA